MKRRAGAAVALALLLSLAASPRAADVALKLVDVAAQAGVTLLNICGGPAKDYIIDEVGSGAAWFDYDNDGNLDLLIVNGSTRERSKAGGDPLVALYRNDGNGKFTDVTARSGLDPPRLGHGRLRRRLRQRRLRRCVRHERGGSERAVPQQRQRDVHRRHAPGRRRRTPGGAPAARSATTTATATWTCTSRNYVAFDERTIAKRGETAGCRFMTVDVSCGPKGLKGEADVLFHNNGRGDVRRRHARRRHQGPGLLRLRRPVHRSRRRRLARHLRGERHDAEFPVSQQPRRHVFRNGAAFPASR